LLISASYSDLSCAGVICIVAALAACWEIFALNE
jgi:hypothetical protein